MKSKIHQFTKTDHFMYRQWDRAITDEMLEQILINAKPLPREKNVFIVLPSFIQRRKKEEQSLVIVLKNNILTTLYFCKDPDYLYRNEPKTNFNIIC